MGGATFPTYVKLKPGKPIDAVLINGSECEPYLTADHRVMLEFADDIVFGLRAMMKAGSAPEGVILIEDNKPDAIALMEEKVAPYDNIRVCAAKTQYPEGAEKMLIKKVMGRQVPSGKLPADVGCVVSNTSTAKAISDAIQKGLPLVERVVSVTGEFIRNPGNYIVKLGTNVQEIIDHCGGITGDGQGTFRPKDAVTARELAKMLLVVLGENALYHLVRFFRGPFVNDVFRGFLTCCFRRSACYHPAAAPSEYYFGILAAVFSDYLFRAAVRQAHPAIQQLVRIHYRYLFAVPAQSAAVFHIVKLREVQRNVSSAYRVSPDGR